jgi:hypothetical protein
MPERTYVRADGVQVTERIPDVVPNQNEKCRATVNLQVVICEPMSDGTWQLVTAFRDGYNLVLPSRNHEMAKDEAVELFEGIKRQCQTECINNLLVEPSTSPLTSSETPPSKTEEL